MVSVDKNQTYAGAAILIQSDLGKPGNTAKIEYYYDANKNGIDDDGSAWTPIAQVTDGGPNSLIQGTTGQIEYRWVPASDLPPGHYLIRVTDSDNSTPKVAGVDISSPATPQISFLVDGNPTSRVNPAGFVTVQADVSNNCALCHSGDPSTWNSSSPGFDEQKMQAHVTADLSGLTGNASDTAVPAEFTLGHGLVGWNVQVSPYLPEGANVQAFIQVTEANLTISSHNATGEGANATSNATTSNATNILANATQSNTTLTITGISEPSYVNNSVVVNVTVLNKGADPALNTSLVFEDYPKEITVNNGGAADIASNSTAVFSVNIEAASSASGNYDLQFYATSGNLTSETRTIPIQIGNPTVAAKSGSPIPGFEAGFVVVGLVIAAYVVTRRR